MFGWSAAGRLGILSNLNLRRLWLSTIAGGAGESLGIIGLPLLVYDMTDSARTVGLITLILILPRVILAPISGLLADHMDRRRLMIAGDVLRMLMVGLMPLTSQVWQVGVLTAGISIGSAITRPAEMSAIPAVAGGRLLVRALSLIQVSNGVVRIVLPAIGAALVALFGPKSIFWLQAIAFLLAAVAARGLRLPDQNRLESFRALIAMARSEMWAGVHAVQAVPIVRGITATESLFQFVNAAMVVAAVVYTEKTLNLGDRADSAFALMSTAVSVGAVLGAILASRIERRIGRGKMLAVGYLGPLFLITAIASPPMPIIYVAWFGFGFTDALAVISFQAYLAESIPADLRGRVYSAWGAIVSLAAAAAFPIIGFITPTLGAPATFGVIGILVGVGAPALLWMTGALQSIKHHVPVEDMRLAETA